MADGDCLNCKYNSLCPHGEEGYYNCIVRESIEIKKLFKPEEIEILKKASAIVSKGFNDFDNCRASKFNLDNVLHYYNLEYPNSFRILIEGKKL